MNQSDPDHKPTPEDLEEHPPGPADHGGHGGMATREVEANEAADK